jgi:hypothetical protein
MHVPGNLLFLPLGVLPSARVILTPWYSYFVLATWNFWKEDFGFGGEGWDTGDGGGSVPERYEVRP